MLRMEVNVFGVKTIWEVLEKIEKKDWRVLRRAAGKAMVDAWKEAVDRSEVKEKTGHLKDSAGWKTKSKISVEFFVRAYYAGYLYYGASPGVGRYVPFMPCVGRGARLVNPWRKRPVKIKTYWQFMDYWERGLITEVKPGVYKALKEQERRHPGRPRKGRPTKAYVAEVNVDIGIWPGIDARKLGLRRWFEELSELYVFVDVTKALERVTGVRLV